MIRFLAVAVLLSVCVSSFAQSPVRGRRSDLRSPSLSVPPASKDTDSEGRKFGGKPIVRISNEVTPGVVNARLAEQQRRAERQQRIAEYQQYLADQQQLEYERYMAEAPLREKYYSALSSAYLAEAARASERAALANERASQNNLYRSDEPQIIYTMPAEYAPHPARTMYWDSRRGVLVRPGEPSYYYGW